MTSHIKIIITFNSIVLIKLLLLLLISLPSNVVIGSHDDNVPAIDPNGYILYCSCMGRFGNQAEQLLGSLQFAKSIDRTLILPPFIQYSHYKVNFIPFDDYIDIKSIGHYHRVITLEKFMKVLAPIVWPEDTRKIMCYSSRGSQEKACNPMDGNPFNAFWTHFGINWLTNQSIYHSPLLTDFNFADEWKSKYNDIKVLAFVGAPSAFPTNKKATKLQQYINFSQKVINIADAYRENRSFARKPYLAIHVRHGTDWIKACELLKANPDLPQLFSSQQCSPKSSSNPLPYELCYPSIGTIVDQIFRVTSESQIDIVYVATDNNNETLWQLIHDMIPNITLITPTKTLWSTGYITDHKPPNDIIIDVYLLSYANHLIANCISSFSAFATRFRSHVLYLRHLTEFFAEQTLDDDLHLLRDEL
ncbi:GDP-fucose protein O-fucosyltransferase 1-like [Oppia nitens]|uniref:GDP-fucose protein O-fucosyltransferase 1-like n=1 Tax=Oppia nitens TaxID=1686743 RepID=UPI0023D9D63E|nr:GDP-fucose protein O-fucosyltransferase 1-like [Oppia nitens]